jgi:rubrerythrin
MVKAKRQFASSPKARLSLKGGSRMEEPNVTASAIISFAEKLEEDSSKFYRQLAEKYIENKELFLSFAEESRKNKVLMIRTYQETITDALEACFIKGINLNDYIAETTLTENADYSTALKMAIELEEKASKFYLDTAARSESLLATIPKAFRKVAERRNNRKLKLKSLLKSL